MKKTSLRQTPRTLKGNPSNKSSSGNTAIVALDGELLSDVRQLIRETRSAVARTVNSGLVGMYWHIGTRIRQEILDEQRADYGRRVVDLLADELAKEYGTGFTRTNLFNMVRFAEAFGDWQIVHTLCGQLSWSHFRLLIYLEKPLQREFYAEMAIAQRWSVRELTRQIQGMFYERVALSKKPAAVVDHAIKSLRDNGEMSPDMVFLDHVNLGALGLRDLVAEKDLENAMLREIEVVLREIGTDFAFLKRQYRFKIGKDTHAIDLLFYNRRLRSLVAVELKLGKFEAAHAGQMELYLRWLEKHEVRPGEQRPYGLILCAEASHECLELLELEESGIRVAEYLTDFPPRELLESQLYAAIERARERVAMQVDPNLSRT